MLCPRDQSTLERQLLVEGIEIDNCTLCGGTWLDKGELEVLQRAHEHDHDSELLVDPAGAAMAFEMARQELEPAVDCPRCSAELQRHEYAWTSQVVIDECPNGCGLWLDKGEIEQIELFFERQHQAPDGLLDPRRMWARFLAEIRRS